MKLNKRNAIKEWTDLTFSELHRRFMEIWNVVNIGISHTQLTDIGTNTHDQIDSHLENTTNPHSVTYTQVGAAPLSMGVTNGDTHNHIGGDGNPITEGSITLADVTTNNVSTSKHGFVKTLSNVATEVLCGNGNWLAVPCSTTAAAITTPLAAGTAGSVGAAADIGHTHRSNGGITSRTSAIVWGNTTVETTILSVPLPTAFFTSGMTFRCYIGGTYQCKATSGTLTFKFYIAGTAALQTVIVPTRTSAEGPVSINLTYYVTVRTLGSSGIYAACASGNIMFSTPIWLDAPVATANVFNSTVENPIVTITGTWQTADASNVCSIRVGILSIDRV